jgi:hypothetical protein
MASTIDTSKPIAGNPTTLSVRANFTSAKNEIEALQAVDALKAPLASPSFTGTATIPTAVVTSLSLNGVTITATGAELNTLAGVTSTTAELNILAGVTATTTELNKLAGVTASTAELNYVEGVTSDIQTQLNLKATAASPTFTGTTTIATADINGGAIDGTTVGSSSASTGAFTTLSTTGDVTQAGATLDATYIPKTSDVNVVTGTADTLATGDLATDIVYTSGSATTVTIPDSLAVGFQCTITAAGAGVVTLTSTDTLNGAGDDLALSGQWVTVYLLQYSPGNWLVSGSLA